MCYNKHMNKTSNLTKIRNIYLDGGIRVDTITSKKTGEIILRQGYFYRTVSLEAWVVGVKSTLSSLGVDFQVMDFGDKHAAFKGGQSVKAGSHFWMILK